MTLNVACVLKTGAEFLPEHVVALAKGVRQHLRQPYRLVCLTDSPAFTWGGQIDIIALKHGWPGWFSKLELFRPGVLDGPVFYVDLDTIIVGSLDEIALGHHFTMLENFWHPSRIGSGLMAWSEEAQPQLARIYDKFCRAPDRYMKEYATPEKWGDQAFIHHHTPVEPSRWQTKFPGKVLSFRKHVLRLGHVPPEAAVVCFGGRCRPWTLTRGQRAWFEETSHVGQLH